MTRSFYFLKQLRDLRGGESDRWNGADTERDGCAGFPQLRPAAAFQTRGSWRGADGRVGCDDTRAIQKKPLVQTRSQITCRQRVWRRERRQGGFPRSSGPSTL